MYLVKTPSILKPLAKDLVWKIDTKEKEAFLTFDDGPTEGVTELVLEILQKFEAKATFFCLGKNAEAHPDLFHRIQKEGHRIGNHTYNHPDGWKTSTIAYLKNVLLANKKINSDLFRPPYGRATPAQVNALKKKFRLIMWQVLSADFDPDITKEKCLENVIHNTEPGSIIVFHDSIKAKDKMLFALEKSLEYLQSEGYIFRTL